MPLALPAPKGPASDPHKLLRKRVRKQFGRRWFMGTVVNYHPTTGYRIQYEDDDEEDLSPEKTEELLV